MTAAVDVLYLPLPAPVRTLSPDVSVRAEREIAPQRHRQPRIYRLPDYDKMRLAYSQTGHAVLSNDTGKFIDLYT